MLDTQPNAVSRDSAGGQPDEASEAASDAESLEDEGYHPPDRHVAALTGKGPLPFVKRFNRKTVAVLVGGIGLVAILAFATALNRKPPYRSAEQSAAETTAAAPSATDAINGLPNSYADVPHLGPRVPGEVGSMVGGNAGLLPAATGLAATTPAGVVSAGQRYTPVETEEAKLAMRAREGGFGFAGASGTSAQAAASGNGLDRLIGAGGLPSMPAGPGPPERRSRCRQSPGRQAGFPRSEPASRWGLKDRLHTPASPYTIFSGTVIAGVLLTGINSDLPGQIEGQISQNVYDTVVGKHLILPQGTKLIGSYDSRITYGQSRVLVVWTRLIRPDGSNIDLEGMPGVDLSGYAGLTGNVDRHVARLVGAVLLGLSSRRGRPPARATRIRHSPTVPVRAPVRGSTRRRSRSSGRSCNCSRRFGWRRGRDSPCSQPRI